MKNTIFILIFSFVIGIQAQTKEETIEWLNTMLDEHTRMYPLGKFSLNIHNDPNHGEIIVITERIKIFNESTYYYSFLPTTIRAVNVTSKYRTSSDFVDIEFVSSGTIYDVERKVLVSHKEILWDGPKEEAFRVQKGILHLLELMGNKIEQKELFKN